MAYLIAMQFVVVDWVIPRNSVLDGGQIPHDKGQFSEGGGVDRANSAQSRKECGIDSTKAVKPIDLPFKMVRAVSSRNCILDGRVHLRRCHVANTTEQLCAAVE